MKCKHLGKCIALLTTLLGKIHPVWNPATRGPANSGPEGDEGITDPLDRQIDRGNETATLAEAITIFREAKENSAP